jgi:fluoride ion exporter CrcB/FEX
MTFNRRDLLKSAFIAAGATAIGTGRALAGSPVSTMSDLRVYDSRVPASRAWLNGRAERVIDVAHEHATRWARLRSVAATGRVAGLTTWSDYVQARGVLLEKGRRVRVESRSGHLFYWEMV